MKILGIFLMLSFSVSSFSQGHTTTGGGLPDDNDQDPIYCKGAAIASMEIEQEICKSVNVVCSKPSQAVISDGFEMALDILSFQKFLESRNETPLLMQYDGCKTFNDGTQVGKLWKIYTEVRLGNCSDFRERRKLIPKLEEILKNTTGAID